MSRWWARRLIFLALNMEIMWMPKSKTIIALVAVAIIIIAAFSIYADETYQERQWIFRCLSQLELMWRQPLLFQPFLDDKVQGEVTVQNGAALWQAQITGQSNVIWEYSAGQGEQTSYSSGWLELPSGSYNFTFRTVGVGSLNAVAAVSSKGGFWWKTHFFLEDLIWWHQKT